MEFDKKLASMIFFLLVITLLSGSPVFFDIGQSSSCTDWQRWSILYLKMVGIGLAVACFRLISTLILYMFLEPEKKEFEKAKKIINESKRAFVQLQKTKDVEITIFNKIREAKQKILDLHAEIEMLDLLKSEREKEARKNVEKIAYVQEEQPQQQKKKKSSGAIGSDDLDEFLRNI